MKTNKLSFTTKNPRKQWPKQNLHVLQHVKFKVTMASLLLISCQTKRMSWKTNQRKSNTLWEIELFFQLFKNSFFLVKWLGVTFYKNIVFAQMSLLRSFKTCLFALNLKYKWQPITLPRRRV